LEVFDDFKSTQADMASNMKCRWFYKLSKKSPRSSKLEFEAKSYAHNTNLEVLKNCSSTGAVCNELYVVQNLLKIIWFKI
jgi:hypothetical protein